MPISFGDEESEEEDNEFSGLNIRNPPPAARN